MSKDQLLIANYLPMQGMSVWQDEGFKISPNTQNSFLIVFSVLGFAQKLR